MISKDKLRGIEAAAAYPIYMRVLMAAFVVPVFNKEKDFRKFIESYAKLPLQEKRDFLHRALSYCSLDRDEQLQLLHFAEDGNGLTYDESNIDNLSWDQILELCCDVLTAYASCKVFF